MKPGQEAAHVVLASEDMAALVRSPRLEGFGARGTEALLLLGGIDTSWPERLGGGGSEPIVSVPRVAPAAETGETPADLCRLVPLRADALKGEASWSAPRIA